MQGSTLMFYVGMLMAVVTASHAAAPAPSAPERITLGQSTVALHGPWRFHVGDDPRWSSPDVDDSTWETVDLSPAPGAHDGDVGLPGYVAGWSRRGHAGYTGYAWYRLRIVVTSEPGTPLALAGPTLLDSAYQLYVNGALLGGSGIFSGETPTVHGVHPSQFALPTSPSERTHTYVIAFRVWMDPVDAGEESGGIHVAPVIGDAASIDRLHQVQWLKTFTGYVADAAEPAAFVVLALMMLALMACRSGDSYRWLAAALILLALLRVNQVLFYWTTSWSLRGYDLATGVLLKPLNLAAWTLAWRDWFGLQRRPWWRRVIVALTVACALFALIGRPWFLPEATHALKGAADFIVQGVRLVFAALYAWVIVLGAMRASTLRGYLAALAAILVGIGLFAVELNALGIPGIWFPYGVGVARGQYAYAIFIPLMFGLILRRLVGYAGKHRAGASPYFTAAER